MISMAAKSIATSISIRQKPKRGCRFGAWLEELIFFDGFDFFDVWCFLTGMIIHSKNAKTPWLAR